MKREVEREAKRRQRRPFGRMLMRAREGEKQSRALTRIIVKTFGGESAEPRPRAQTEWRGPFRPGPNPQVKGSLSPGGWG
jgi:hypothetical protein